MSKRKRNREVHLTPYKVQKVSSTSSEYVPEGMKMIQAQVQWDKGNEGEGVVVAIIDTGADYNHPDLKDNIIGGKDFTGTGDYMDGHGHGTHVAGTIAASNTGTGIVGVAPKAKLIILKALDDKGSGDINWTVAALRYAISKNVDIINMSLGGPDTPELRAAVKEAVGLGIIICAAAGNAGDGDETTEELDYPGSYAEVIEVGAVDYEGKLAAFSNTNHEVDILAPGVRILSTYLNGKYARMDGTSMATPHMTGAVALLKSNDIRDYSFATNILNVSKPRRDPVPPPVPPSDNNQQIPSLGDLTPYKPKLEPTSDPVAFLLKIILMLVGGINKGRGK